MKKILISLLILAMLVAATSVALAVEPTDSTPDTQDERKQILEDLFDEYNPSQKQVFLDITAEHKAFHESRQGLREDAIKDHAGQISVITGQIADDTLSTAEGREKLKEIRDNSKTTREDVKEILEQKKLEAEAIKGEITSLREKMKTALEKDDANADEVAGYLSELNTLLQKHLDMDYKYAEMVDALLES